MEKGKVKWYDAVKGFGFIETEAGKDIFVHRSGLANKFGGLNDGDTVEFEVSDGQRGPIASNVSVVE
ncbi:MAG: cold-shock protein [Bacteroidales bacterium]|nr:cold-shock protein [Bacteroidales bacterium]MBN2818111.1 cold-shock protein [Bacteroidales bacterium]